MRSAALTSAFMPVRHSATGAASPWPLAGLPDLWEAPKPIVVGQLTSPGVVKIYSSGSVLEGGPEMYLESASAHSPAGDLPRSPRFKPFGEATGVSVATTSTAIGADLLVSGAAQEQVSAGP